MHALKPGRERREEARKPAVGAEEGKARHVAGRAVLGAVSRSAQPRRYLNRNSFNSPSTGQP